MPDCAICAAALTPQDLALGHTVCSLKCFDLWRARRRHPAPYRQAVTAELPPQAAAAGIKAKAKVKPSCAYCCASIAMHDRLKQFGVYVHKACAEPHARLAGPPPQETRTDEPKPRDMDAVRQRERNGRGRNNSEPTIRKSTAVPIHEDQSASRLRQQNRAADDAFALALFKRLDPTARERALSVRIRAGDALLDILGRP